MFTNSLFTVALVLSGLICGVAGHAFLEKHEDKAAARYVDRVDIEMRFLQEVRAFVGTGPADRQLPAIRQALEPIWLALPKNEHGRLQNSQVRYMLHRYFVQRHGWKVDGLDQRSNSRISHRASVLRQQVPTFLMDVFDEAFGGSGLMLDEIAIFAATLEHMIHNEATERLKDVYRAMMISPKEALSEKEAEHVMKAYAMSLLQGQDTLNSSDTIFTYLEKLPRVYTGWQDTVTWLNDVRGTVDYLDGGAQNPFVAENEGLYSFQQMEKLTHEVSQRFGRFQDSECRQQKNRLLESEEGNSGRIRLSEFYKKGIKTLQFVEKQEYLRQLGALDESKSGEPRVIVPNYILSAGNCLADMGFYSVCCINECEAVMSQIERAMGAPQATPQRLAALLTNISTSTVEADRGLSPAMHQRLQHMAARNSGVVPLHGRLFAQLLHYAFPRECPYPHKQHRVLSTTTSTSTKENWIEIDFQDSVESHLDLDAMQEYISAHDNASATESTGVVDNDEKATMWSDEEEILYLPKPISTYNTWPKVVSRCMAGLVAMACFGFAAMDFSKRTGSMEALGIKDKSHLV